MYSVLNTPSEYVYLYISRNITSHTFLLVFKIVESLQCILKASLKIRRYRVSCNGVFHSFHKEKYLKLSVNVQNYFVISEMKAILRYK